MTDDLMNGNGQGNVSMDNDGDIDIFGELQKLNTNDRNDPTDASTSVSASTTPAPTPTPKEEGIKDLDSILGMVASSGDKGTGDTVQDLIDWVAGKAKLPSDPLSAYLNGAMMKSEFGLHFLMLMNIERIKGLNDFIKAAEAVIYNPDDVIGLETDDIRKRLDDAQTTYQNLFEMNRRSISMMKNKKSEEELDRMKMLIAAIPSNKLKELISGLSK